MGWGGKGPLSVAVFWTECLIAGGFVWLRVWSRYRKGSTNLSDSWVLLATWLLQILFSIFFTVSGTYGYGMKTEDFRSDKDLSMALKTELMAETTIACAMGLSKVVVAMFLYQIVVTTWQKVVLGFWMATIMIISLLASIGVFTRCNPVESLWSVNDDGVCTLDFATVLVIQCCWGVLADFFLALFPWYILRNLNMPRKEKTTICISLSLGVFAGILGIVRTSLLPGLATNKKVDSDYLYATAEFAMLSSSELTLSIICVSIPILRPLWNRFRDETVSEATFGNHTRQLLTIGGTGAKLVGPAHRLLAEENDNGSRSSIGGSGDIAVLARFLSHRSAARHDQSAIPDDTVAVGTDPDAAPKQGLTAMLSRLPESSYVAYIESGGPRRDRSRAADRATGGADAPAPPGGIYTTQEFRVSFLTAGQEPARPPALPISKFSRWNMRRASRFPAAVTTAAAAAAGGRPARPARRQASAKTLRTNSSGGQHRATVAGQSRRWREYDTSTGALGGADDRLIRR